MRAKFTRKVAGLEFESHAGVKATTKPFNVFTAKQSKFVKWLKITGL